MEDVYESKDRQIVPFLLIQPEVKFFGTREAGGIVYFRFFPSDNCLKLANDFVARKAPVCQPKDLLDAVESFKTIIFQVKGGEHGS